MGCGASRESERPAASPSPAPATPPPPRSEPDVPVTVIVPPALPNSCACAKCSAAASAAAVAAAAAAAAGAGDADTPPPPLPVTRLGVSLRGLRRIRQRLREFFGEERYAAVSTATVNAEWVQVVTRDRRVRAAEAPDLVDPQDVGVPLYFISHAWKNSFELLLRGIEGFLASAAEDTRVWVDILAVNQHADSGQQAGDVGAFADVVHAAAAGTLVVMDLSSCNPATRAWCIYEWAHTLADHGPDGLHMAGLGPEERGTLVGSLDVEAAECFKEEDKAFIMSNVVQHHGSPTAFNTKLKLQLMLEPLSYRVDLRRLQQRAAATAPAPASPAPTDEAPTPPPTVDRRAAGAGAQAAWDLGPIREWLLCPDGGAEAPRSRVLVVSAGAGEGKSTLSALLCADPAAGGLGDLIAAHHFLKYNDLRRLEPLRILKSLAFQLASRFPSVSEHLLSLDVPGIARQTDTEPAFRQLLQQPLEALPTEQRPPHGVVLLLDALDEADPLDMQLAAPPPGGADGAGAAAAAAVCPTVCGNGALQLVTTLLAGLPGWVRLLLTTRPDAAAGQVLPALRRVFAGQGLTEMRPADLHKPPGDGPAPEAAAVQERAAAAPPPQPGGVRGGGGLLVYHTALSALHAAGTCLTLPRAPKLDDLYDLYGKIFRAAFDALGADGGGDGGDGAEPLRRRVSDLIAVTVAAREPLSQSLLQQLGLGGVVALLPGHPTLFFVDEHHLYTLHKSLADWLVNGRRSGPFAADLVRGHSLLGLHLAANWKAAGDKCMPYTLKHAVHHLAAAVSGAAGAGGGGAAAAAAASALDELLTDFAFVAAVAKSGHLPGVITALGSMPPAAHTPLSHDALRWLLVQQQALGASRYVPLEGYVAMALRSTPHTAPLHAVAVAAGGQGWRTARVLPRAGAVWSKLKSVLPGHWGNVNGVAFSPDGAQVASASADSDLKVFAAATGACLATLKGHTGGVRCVDWSPDGRLLASGSQDSTVRLWDAATGQCVHTLTGHSHAVVALAFSPGPGPEPGPEPGPGRGALLASAGQDDSVRLWAVAALVAGTATDKKRCKVLWVTKEHQGVSSVSFSHDGRLLATGTYGGTTLIWTVAQGQVCSAFTPFFDANGRGPSVLSVSFNPRGDTLVTGSVDRMVRWLEQDPSGSKWRVARRVAAHTGAVTCVRHSPDGSRLASTGDDFTAAIWSGDADSNRCASRLRGHRSCVSGLAWSPDGSVLATCGEDQTVRLWETSPQDAAALSDAAFELRGGVAWSPDRSAIACIVEGKNVHVWGLETGELCKMADQTDTVTAVAWSPDGVHIASGGRAHGIVVWDWPRFKWVAKLSGHPRAVLSLAWDPCEPMRLVSSGSGDAGKVRVWNVATKECSATIETRAHEDTRLGCDVVQLAFAPAPRAAASGGSGSEGEGGGGGSGGGGGGRALLATVSTGDGAVRLWDVATGECRGTLDVWLPESVSWSPDGSRLAIAAHEHILVWDVGSLGEGGGEGGAAGADGVKKLGVRTTKRVAWSPDGSLLALVSEAEGEALCDPETGEIVARLHGHTGSVEGLAWAPGAEAKLLLATVSDDKTVRMWEPVERVG